MIKNDDIKKLALLARLDVTDEEIGNLASEIEAILEYVSAVDEVSEGEHEPKADGMRNIMREDTEPHRAEIFTKDLLKQMPDTENGYLKVKKIL